MSRPPISAARRALTLFPILGTAVLPSFAFADDAGQPVATLAPIVVSATRTPTPKDQVASSVTVITADDIAAQGYRTLPDALNDVPGLNVVQTGGPGGQTSVFTRGTNSNHTKILVDGIDVADPSTPNDTFDLSNLLLGDVERIEVLRGPQSGLYGSDAIGGVISITTKKGDGPMQFRGNLEGGTFGTFNQNASVSGSVDRYSYDVSVSHFHSEATPVTPLDLLAPGEARNDDFYDNVTLSTKLGVQIVPNFDLGLVLRYTETDYKFTSDDYNFYPAVPEAQQSEEKTRQMYTRGTAHLVMFDGMLDQTLGLAYTDNRTSNLSPGTSPSDQLGDRVKADWLGTVHVMPGEIVLLGAEYDYEDIQNSPISANTTTNAGFVQLQSSLGDRFFDSLAVRYDDNDRFGGKTTYHEAPEFVITETGTTLKGSVGTGFKAPSLDDLFVSYPAYNFFANPNLKPETSFGWDIGFEQALLEKRLSFGATYFRNDIHNLIEDNATYTSQINVDKATTQGMESFIAFKPIQHVSLRADYTYTYATNDSLHQEQLRIPRHKATLTGTWDATDELSLNATLFYEGPRIDGNRDFSIPRLHANGFATVNLGGTYDLSDNWSIYGHIDNLFDRTYENPDGFLQPGRAVYGGIRAKF